MKKKTIKNKNFALVNEIKKSKSEILAGKGKVLKSLKYLR